MIDTPVYLDNHATTQVDPRVVEAMLPFFTQHFGNAGSVSHAFGHAAEEAVDAARVSIAAAINAQPREIVFTSGATESNNLAIRGAALHPRRRGGKLKHTSSNGHIISVTTEHKAVLDPLQRLTREGYEVSLLEVQPQEATQPGWLDPQRVADAIREDTALVTVMLVNNETGVIQPVQQIGAICREHGVPLHCDATQAVGRIPVDVKQLNVDLLSFSAHKMYGPKGSGALFVRRGSPRLFVQPLVDGGGQEQGLRSGTLNVPGIAGLAKALELCTQQMEEETTRLRMLRKQLYTGICELIDDVPLNGPPLEREDLRIAANLNCSFSLVDGETLMMRMGDVAVSSGSACTSTNPEPSHVLRAMNLEESRVRSSLRFGLGRFNTEAEIDFAVQRLAAVVKELRGMSSYG